MQKKGTLNLHFYPDILVWTKATGQPGDACSSPLTFVFFSRPSSENIIISLTLTAQLVGFISSHRFLTHCELHPQTDGSSLFPNPPCPTALPPIIRPFFHPLHLTLQTPCEIKKKDEDKKKKHGILIIFFPLVQSYLSDLVAFSIAKKKNFLPEQKWCSSFNISSRAFYIHPD